MTEKNENIVSGRELVIPLKRDFLKVPRYERTSRAIKTIKKFVARHMKIRDRDLDKVKLNRYFNNHLWQRGKTNPPVKIKVFAKREGDFVMVDFVEVPENVKFAKARHEKMHISKAPSSESISSKEDKKETSENEKEKEQAVAEINEKSAKQASKEEKHTVKTKTPKTAKERTVLSRH